MPHVTDTKQTEGDEGLVDGGGNKKVAQSTHYLFIGQHSSSFQTLTTASSDAQNRTYQKGDA